MRYKTKLIGLVCHKKQVVARSHSAPPHSVFGRSCRLPHRGPWQLPKLRDMYAQQDSGPRSDMGRMRGLPVSDTDSFINEVSEEVRKDQLYGYIKRYGWIAVLVILVLVGGAAYSEWTKAQARTASQAAGDAMLDALSENDIAARAKAMQEVAVDGPAAAVTGLLTAAAQQEAGDVEAARATLSALAVNADIPQTYRDVAAFKGILIADDSSDPAARRQTLEALATPGQPFRLLALEQIALIDVAGGETEAAVTTLRAVLEDAAVTRGLRERAQSLIVALGAEIDPASAE